MLEETQAVGWEVRGTMNRFKRLGRMGYPPKQTDGNRPSPVSGARVVIGRALAA